MEGEQYDGGSAGCKCRVAEIPPEPMDGSLLQRGIGNQPDDSSQFSSAAASFS